MKTKGQIWILYHSLMKRQTAPLSPIQMQKLLLSIKLRDINEYFIWTPGWTEWESLVKFLKSPQTYFVLTAIPTPPQRKEETNIPMIDLLDEHTRSKIVDSQIYNDKETNSMFFEDDGSAEFTTVDTEKQQPPAVDINSYYANDFRAEDINVHATPSLKDQSKPEAEVENGRNRRVADRHNFKLEIILISRSGKTFKTYSKNISLGGTMLEDPLPKDFLQGDIEMMITSRIETDKSKGRLHFRGKIVGDIRNPLRLTFKEASPQMMEKLEALLKSYVAQQKATEKIPKAE